MKRKFMKHQRTAHGFIEERNGCAGIFMAPGTGKTLVAIRYAQQFTPALVICRRDDFFTWQQELEMEGVPDRHINTIESGNQRLLTKPRKWTLVTYDLTKNPKIMAWIKKHKFGIVCADESHTIKRWSSERTKATIRSTRHIPNRIAMTGSPITNDPIDIYSQSIFIDNGAAFGDNEWRFRNKYYLRVDKGWYLRRDAKKKITDKLAKLAFYVHEDDVLKLPPIRRYVKACPMTGVQRRLYEQVLEEWEVQLSSGEMFDIDHTIVQLSKLKQIASGFIYDQEKEPHYIKSRKLSLLFDLLTDTDELGRKRKVVVWASHTAEIEAIIRTAKSKRIRCIGFYGGNRAKKTEARKQFRDNKKLRLFIGQVDSGVGMNELVVADTAIYYSNSFKVVSRQQSMRRIRRKGTKAKVITYIDLVTEKTVDRHVLQSVETKMSLASMILDEIKRGRPIRKLLT